MASTSLSSAPSLVDIRFGKTDAVVVVLSPSNQSDLLGQLKKRLGKASAIYQNEPLVIDLATWKVEDLEANPLALKDIQKISQTAGMNLIEVRSHLDEFEEACENLGIRHSEPKAEAKQEPRSDESKEEEADSAPGVINAGPAASAEDNAAPPPPEAQTQNQQTELDLSPEPAAPANSGETAVATVARKSMVVNNPVRSGQRVYAQGADLVVMGQVSAGAEVIADGNVHVYGVLRGRALAGAAGDTEARILSTCFEAELVSIAGYYLTFEAGHPADVRSQPTLIQLDDGEPEKTVRIKPINIR